MQGSKKIKQKTVVFSSKCIFNDRLVVLLSFVCFDGVQESKITSERLAVVRVVLFRAPSRCLIQISVLQLRREEENKLDSIIMTFSNWIH